MLSPVHAATVVRKTTKKITKKIPKAPTKGAASTTQATGKVVPGGALAGDLSLSFPAGEKGKVSLTLVGPVVQRRTQTLLVLRNNTASTVYNIEVGGVARVSGKLVAAGQWSSILPSFVGPGSVGVGVIHWSAALPDQEITYELEVTSQSGERTNPAGRIDATVTEFEIMKSNPPQIVGILRNTGSVSIQGPVSVFGVCFDSDGKPIGTATAYANPDSIPPSGTASFAATLYDFDACPRALLGAHGWRN